MKKITHIILLVLALGLYTNAFADKMATVHEQLTEKRNGLVINDTEKTTSMLIPNPGATPDEVRQIARKEGNKIIAGVNKQNETFLQKKDTQTAAALVNLGKKIDGLGKKGGVLDNLDKKSNSTNDLLNKLVGGWVVTAIIIAFVAIMCMIILVSIWKNSRANTTPQPKKSIQTNQRTEAGTEAEPTIRDVIKEIKDAKEMIIKKVPEMTRDEIRKFDDRDIAVKVNDHKVTYKLAPGADEYKSLDVSPDFPDTPDILKIMEGTTAEPTRNALVSSVKSTIRRFLKGDFNDDSPRSRMQRDLIKHMIDIDRLTITGV